VTGRAAAIQGGLAALGLLAAHFTWQREPEHAPGSAVVIDASKSDVTLVHYEDDAGSVDLSRGHGGNEPPLWVHLVTRPKSDVKPDPKDPHKTVKNEPAPPRDLPGSEGALKIYDDFAPLVSPRAFGPLDASKLKELGLDAPKRKLDVTVKGDVRHYEIGQPGNASAGESFLRDKRDGRVYLMPRTMLQELQNGSHMVDRRLHTFEPVEFDRIVVTASGKQKEYLHVARESHAASGFASPKTPDKRDQMAKNWHDAVWRIFPSDLLGRGEQPPAGKPVVAVKVEYFDHKTSLGWIEIARPEASGGMSDDGAPSADTFVRSEHTAGWAKIGGGQLIADAQKLIAAP
jgi:Domain of unknown function (DUF4340)